MDNDPAKCAKMHCDAHVVKMMCEYAQILSTAHRVIDGKQWWGRTAKGRKLKVFVLEDRYMNTTLYKASHVNHPSNIWVRQSIENYQWLVRMWLCLADEYKYRYGKVHASYQKLHHLLTLEPMNISKDNGFTQPPPAIKDMTECVVQNDSVETYRNFYWADKRGFAKWTRRRKPKWWKEFENAA